MTQSIPRLHILLPGAILTAVTTLLCAPAQATIHHDTETDSVTVHFADLDPSSAHGAKRLYTRLRMAAREVCGDYTEAVDLTEMRDIALCERTAIAGAVEQVNRPPLTAIYDHQYPHEPITVAMAGGSLSVANVRRP